MTQDAFELLQEANPMPEDPPPLPIAPLLERVEQLPPLPPVGKGPDRRSKGRLTLIAVVAVAVGVLAFTRSTTHSPPGSSVAVWWSALRLSRSRRVGPIRTSIWISGRARRVW